MFGSKKQKASTRIDSLIGVEAKIQGNIMFAGGLRVDGEIVGDVSANDDKQSTLVVSEKAKISGSIQVGHLVLNGMVEGPIHATQYLELQSKCKVVGDVFYATLEMHPGAIVDGKLIHLNGANGAAATMIDPPKPAADNL
ncbi:bactofilin family protein [Parachitinimonas caeni]|uniref:bactofilin family protein n=1 Tax=Parachitinimonas caeni TaxID=3031301 RepID=UPI0027E4F391|nr:polymer-forming cytoskeletal protein [Parachitinimonas caeni]